MKMCLHLRDFIWKIKHRQEILDAVMTPVEDLTANQIKFLPKRHIIERLSPVELATIWKDLREDVKRDPNVQFNLPCMEHYNRSDQSCHFDGPPPKRSRCDMCMRSRR